MSSGGPGAWPPAVREWVSKCLGAMTSGNREAAQAELKSIIASAYATNELWTIDWSKKELESLKQSTVQPLKRKSDPPTLTPVYKKQKKSTTPAATTGFGGAMDKLQERAMRFQREHDIERQKQKGTYSSKEQYSAHVNSSSVFNNGNASTNSWASSSGPAHNIRKQFLQAGVGASDSQEAPFDTNVIDWDKFTISGTSQELFKPYLRITTAPDPSKIRPLFVLEYTLKELSRRWREKPDYVWTCDQFKSLRQDLTVQRIKNRFTVQVYEIHARMALESADLVEYNQCQAMLRDLYALDLEGSRDEFLAYRILYLCYTRDRSEMNRLISPLTLQQKNQVFVKQALEIQRALTTNNYHKFFRLFLNAHNMGGYILDHLVERERVNALVIMTKSYQQLSVSFLTTELQFDSAEHAVSFLHDNGAAFFVSKPTPSTSSSTNGGSAKSSRLAKRVDSLSLEEQKGSDEDKILDCRSAYPPLVECLATKHARVGIKGSI